jgi:hypothetical protein
VGYLITVGFKQTWFNVICYPLRYKYVNQTTPKYYKGSYSITTAPCCSFLAYH